MSGVNGDKSRFHRQRKQKLARRIRDRKLFENQAMPRKPASTTPGSKAEPVSA
jgi:hypothetical protein